ncbi:IniB N-terminal domain-containing protein [Lentzea sp. NPDC005914]|uniref:IniB N-terminal domain-containing protein n=1 Tax=Lentzea sp. NPDC005914 TaxID=3154572 RepID=UPI003408A582
MIESTSTLHDFVLNLLSDPALKAAFANDAQGTLEQAGLADITAVDVQEVIPLVIDLLPATPAGLPALDSVSFVGLPHDVLEDGPLGAISQLQAVASQLTTSGVSLGDITSSSAGLLAADESGMTVWAGTHSADIFGAGEVKFDGDFSAVGDVTSVLDQTASPVTGTVLDVADTATSTVDGTLGTVTHTVPGVDGVLGHVTGVTGLGHDALGVLGGGDASLGNLLNVGGLDHISNGNVDVRVPEAVGGVEHAASGVVDTATSLTGSATGLVGDHAGVGNVLGGVTHVTHDLPVVNDGLDLHGLLG